MCESTFEVRIRMILNIVVLPNKNGVGDFNKCCNNRIVDEHDTGTIARHITGYEATQL